MPGQSRQKSWEGRVSIVFVVEDAPALLIAAEEMLKRAGHDVVTAASVDQALSIIDSGQDFDLLFTDLTLGAHLQGGIKVARHLAIRRPGLPIVCTSARAMPKDAPARFAEPNSFLPKPYSMAGLLQAVKEATSQLPAPSLTGLSNAGQLIW
jgi:CheY-like chemotaxis protein